MTRLREGQTFGGTSLLVRYINFVKLPHTVFALPFALVGATLASFTRGVTAASLGWVVLAFTAARFAAMGFNRIVDRQIDAKNPRTATREIPAGLLGVREASLAVLIAGLVFVFAAWELNPLDAVEPDCPMGTLVQLHERFTLVAHRARRRLAIAPVGGYLAVSGCGARRVDADRVASVSSRPPGSTSLRPPG
jgi:4-hydroxybenzoate polyprenyltransferase